MLDYLENLRKRPEAERRKIVFRISLAITFVIASFWAGSLFLNKRISPTQGGELSQTMPSLKETFSSFFNSVGRIFDNGEVFEKTEIAPSQAEEVSQVPEATVLGEESTTTEPVIFPEEESINSN